MINFILSIFMNMETYDQIELNISSLGDEAKFLKENLIVSITSYEGEVIGMSLPDKIEYQVTHSEPAVKGNTSSGAMKDATLENGMTIKVPLFIEEGETIIVSTSDGKYVNSLPEDQEVEYFYTVEINGIVIEGSKIIKAEGKKFQYYTEQAVAFLEEYFKDITVVYDQIELPETDDLGRVEIVWTSSDLKVISHDGALQTFDPDKEVKMTAEIKCYDGQVT